MKQKWWLPAGLVLLLAAEGRAQTGLFYNYYDSVQVTRNGRVLELPWCGGLDVPQLLQADLNNDGKKDLIIYNKTNDGVQTFLNTGGAGQMKYVFAPRYARFFPKARGYMILRDYNCDGVPDLFNRLASGVTVFKGFYNSHNELQFTFYKNLRYNITPTGPIANTLEVYVNALGDIPVIDDVDGDGDIDVLAMNDAGGYVNFYRNRQKEDGLPCDSIVPAWELGCWGHMYQTGYRGFLEAKPNPNSWFCDVDASVRIPVLKTRDAGDCLCMVDYDKDGDHDLFMANIKYDETQLLYNGGSNTAAVMTVVDTMFQKNGNVLHLTKQPCGFNVDLDNDGHEDLLFAPAADTMSKNVNCIAFYRNNTGSGRPYEYRGDTALSSQMIDLGSNSQPVFYDYNKDGKPDLFISSRGVYNTVSATYKPSIQLYLNTNTPGHPAFELSNADFLSVASSPGYTFQGAYPAFGDVDGDGVDDVVLGKHNGTLSYYRNAAASNAVPPSYNFVTHQLANINLGKEAKPTFYDVDGDGLQDLVVGYQEGKLACYLNHSTGGNVVLDLLSKDWGKVWVPMAAATSGMSAPVFAPVDTSGKTYLLVGASDGYIYRYTGFEQNPQGIFTLVDSLSAPQPIWVGQKAAPAIADIDSDGRYELVVGNSQGGLYLFKQDTVRAWDPAPVISLATVEVELRRAVLDVYPNPAHNQVSVRLSNNTAGKHRLVIMDMGGRLMLEDQWQATQAETNRTYSLANMPAGIYLLIVKDETGNVQSARIVKQ
jgi:hypothetical protein